jgi:probable F420-dependent oxidoreductase
MVQLGYTLPNYRGNATPAKIVETAQRADRLGYHSVWVADHIAIPASYEPRMGTVLYETHTTLTYVAALTTNVKLGCSVMPTPYRHPLYQAKLLGTLDQLSNGRVIYGGATGYVQEEFHALGIDFTKRAAITDEYLDVIKMAWTQPVVNFHGQFVDAVDMTVHPQPMQKPHPPIWLGGDSDGQFKRIVRVADGWHGLFGGTPGGRSEEPTIEHFGQRVARLRQFAEEAGRDPATISISIKSGIQIGPDGPRPFVGSVAKIVDSIKQMEELGLELIVISPNLGIEPTPMDLIDEYASQIMEAVK